MSSEPIPGRVQAVANPIKILIAGGFGVGKTTLVGTVSEIVPLHTEEVLTTASARSDDLSGVESKVATTITMDFGRITIADQAVLYLFGTPGQDRFKFLWDELVIGALGAVVLADMRRLADSFPSIDYFEQRRMPFVVAVNCFLGEQPFHPAAVRDALSLDPDVPMIMCDARDRQSGREVLIALLEHVRDTAAATPIRAPAGQGAEG